MRDFKLIDVCLGDVSIRDAVGLVFSYDTLKEIHGPSTEVGPWSAAGKREVNYKHDVRTIQFPLKRFVMKDYVPVVASQTMQQMNDRCCVVDSCVRMRCFGARLIGVNASFKLERKGEPKKTYFSGEVKVSAALPGMKKNMEALLIENAEKEMRRYAALVQAKSSTMKVITQIFNAHPTLFV